MSVFYQVSLAFYLSFVLGLWLIGITTSEEPKTLRGILHTILETTVVSIFWPIFFLMEIIDRI